MKTKDEVVIRKAKTSELKRIGELMVDVYSSLDGFPKESEQPRYYDMLRNVGDMLAKPGTEILVAVNETNEVLGAVVYFNNMAHYGSGGVATSEKEAAGFRLLAVTRFARGKGIGKLLTVECINKAKHSRLKQLIIHTTKAMMPAWKMYEALGFKRSEDLDFVQGELPVFGFRLYL